MLTESTGHWIQSNSFYFVENFRGLNMPEQSESLLEPSLLYPAFFVCLWIKWKKMSAAISSLI